MHYKTPPGCKPKQSKQKHQKDWKVQFPGDSATGSLGLLE